MTVHVLPALDGRTPLGFLAALGILRLLSDNGHPDAELAFAEADHAAHLYSRHSDLDAVIADLRAVAEGIPADGVLPDMPAEFPPPGAAPDRLRLPRNDFRSLAANLQTQLLSGDADNAPGWVQAERWLCSLVTDLTLDDKGRSDVSLYTAHSGKQSMHTMLRSPLSVVRDNPEVLRQALTGWRRFPGVTGEYLDNQVLYDAADAPDGTSRERGVPGATWLALMSYPLFLTTAAGTEPITSGWQRLRRGRGSVNRLIYPLWSRPVDCDGAVALLTHPVLKGAPAGPPPAAARAASVFLICQAERQRLAGRTFAGVLTPIRPQPPVASIGTKRRPGPVGPAVGGSAWIA